MSRHNIKKWIKIQDVIYKKIIQRNRYSQYIDFTGWKGEDAAYLQAFILADLGDTVQEQTEWEIGHVVKLFEEFFESNFKSHKSKIGVRKPKTEFIWRGIDAREIRNILPDKKPVTTSKIGSEVTVMAKRNKLIEIRTFANRHYYLANGYKFIMND